jgi:hypothetical protein
MDIMVVVDGLSRLSSPPDPEGAEDSSSKPGMVIRELEGELSRDSVKCGTSLSACDCGDSVEEEILSVFVF